MCSATMRNLAFLELDIFIINHGRLRRNVVAIYYDMGVDLTLIACAGQK